MIKLESPEKIKQRIRSIEHQIKSHIQMIHQQNELLINAKRRLDAEKKNLHFTNKQQRFNEEN